MSTSNALVALANITLSTTATTVTFSSISQAYTDLILTCQVKATTGGSSTVLTLKLNNDTTSSTSGSWGYSRTTGTVVATGTTFGAITGEIGSTNFQLAKFVIYDYSSTSKHKSVTASGSPGVVAGGSYRSSTAVTSIVIFAHLTSADTFAAGSSFQLYGVI